MAAQESFTWEAVLRIPPHSEDSPLDLSGFFEKIRLCNRGSELKSEFLPFLVEDHTVGYIHTSFADHLRRFGNVFVFPKVGPLGIPIGDYVTLHPTLATPDDRTEAVGRVVKCLGEELIPGIRNELYPVMSSFGSKIFFTLERAAAPYFGIKPHGMTCGENMMKECEEEAGIPRCISKEVKPVGSISYLDIDGPKYKRDIIFCYDLKVPEHFIPENQDGEVESFKLLPVRHVASIVSRTQFFEPSCAVAIIDFLLRHGYICPEDSGYLKLLHSLRTVDCS